MSRFTGKTLLRDWDQFATKGNLDAKGAEKAIQAGYSANDINKALTALVGERERHAASIGMSGRPGEGSRDWRTRVSAGSRGKDLSDLSTPHFTGFGHGPTATVKVDPIYGVISTNKDARRSNNGNPVGASIGDGTYRAISKQASYQPAAQPAAAPSAPVSNPAAGANVAQAYERASTANRELNAARPQVPEISGFEGSDNSYLRDVNAGERRAAQFGNSINGPGGFTAKFMEAQTADNAYSVAKSNEVTGNAVRQFTSIGAKVSEPVDTAALYGQFKKDLKRFA